MRNEKGYLEIKQFVDCQKLKKEALGKKEDEQRRDEAYNAFHFWGLIKKYSKHDNLQERREFLRKFVDNQNRYIALVAMIESLPVSIWRRILWRHNINHESLFSFLRRISPKNMQAIKENYFDLCVNGKQPRILKFYEKWRKKFSVQSLLEEQDAPDLRNKKKGSWSYNFLGLDFGFNAYTGNLNNDEMTEAKNWRDFLSIKNHAKDFVVDREFGKYWWFYRTARSNWGWMRNRIVKLSDHICPGFWYTLAIHFLFWIASPLALIHILSFGYDIKGFGDLFYKIPFLCIALFTPLWSLGAATWSLIRLVLPVNRRKELVRKFESRIFQVFFSSIIGFVIVVVLLGLFLSIWEFFYICFGSPIGSFVLIVLLILYFGTHVKEERLVCFSERSVVFQIIYASTACYVFTLFFVHFGKYSEKMLEFLFSFLFSLGMTGIILTLFFLFPLFVIVMSRYFEKNPILKKILNFSAALVLGMKIIGGFYLATAFFTLLRLIKTMDFSQAMFMSTLMVVFWGAIYSFFMYRFFNLLLQRDAEIEYALVAYPSSLFAKLKPFNGLELRWYLRNNKIWKSLEIDDRTDLLNQAYDLSLVLSDCSDHEKTYLRKLLPVLSHTMIGKIKNANLDEVSSGRERSMIFRLMLSGMSFEKARKLSREKTIDKIERKVKINRLIKWFLKPFYWVYERLSQLVWLKKKFYEMCPFVMREGKIDMYN